VIGGRLRQLRYNSSLFAGKRVTTQRKVLGGRQDVDWEVATRITGLRRYI
jgi:hypothetical protein